MVEAIEELRSGHGFSNYILDFLEKDKGLNGKDFSKLLEVMDLPDESFSQRRGRKGWLEGTLDEGDSVEITEGRYHGKVAEFHDISSEQALVRGRMQFSMEYMIRLADLVASPDGKLVSRAFSPEEKDKLRSAYEDFRTKDYAAVKIIEGRTKQDVVAANTWTIVRAAQLGIDPELLRGINHFARTSDDVTANVTGMLYMNAFGQFASSLAKLEGSLMKKAKDHISMTCIARTHGQEAQLTTLGHVYANLAEQIRLHAEPFLQPRQFRLEGKMAGATGTDIDMRAALSGLDPRKMYNGIVEDVFGLRNVELGNDQSLSHAAFARMLDGIQNVGLAITKSATDTWIYASRHILSKSTEKGESGSSAMPQKANPFFAESAEALFNIVGGMISPIKHNVVAYREQGDLRRSITTREAFHPLMLAIIAVDRMNAELGNYGPHIGGIENEVYRFGPQVVSSAIQTYLRARGVSDAYDRVKDIAMKPFVKPHEVSSYINGIVSDGKLSSDDGGRIIKMLHSVMDTKGLMAKLESASSAEETNDVLAELKRVNSADGHRRALLGTTVRDTRRMIYNAGRAVELLKRYAA